MKKRVAVYSSSRRLPPAPAVEAQAEAPRPPRKPIAWKKLRVPAAAALALLLALSIWLLSPSQAVIPPLPPEAAAPLLTPAEAYEKIRPSVVHVRGIPEVEDPENDTKPEGNVGTGVVIVDTGIILTNLHVVYGSKQIKITFADGTESAADVIGERPEHDLAVLQAKELPDDLQPATLRSTNGLRPGDQVVAVGFPFGIGPSASAGVISGLKREYRASSGKRLLSNLIQFDAAVNPGNSGGPLVTADGEVVGIVTGLLNPTEQRVFIGIGFAVPIENAAGAVGLNPF
ncbi:MAG TPA: trypsin-like peptidase domain-containing protein [Burkholderiales bacterium]